MIAIPWYIVILLFGMVEEFSGENGVSWECKKKV